MGTGSFGGGSGSFGSGGSGSTGDGSKITGGSASLKVATGRMRKKTNSVVELISSLLRLSRDVNKDPSLAQARKVLSEMIQDRGRKTFFIEVLKSPFINGLLNDLLALDRDLDGRFNWRVVARLYDLDSQRASLSALLRAMIATHRSRAADERHVEIGRRAVSDILLKAIGNDLDAYLHMSPDVLAQRFNMDFLHSTCGHLLSGLMRHAVLRDVVNLSEATQVSMETASLEIADVWYTQFRAKFYGNAIRNRNILNVIAEHYDEFAS